MSERRALWEYMWCGLCSVARAQATGPIVATRTMLCAASRFAPCTRWCWGVCMIRPKDGEDTKTRQPQESEQNSKVENGPNSIEGPPCSRAWFVGINSCVEDALRSLHGVSLFASPLLLTAPGRSQAVFLKAKLSVSRCPRRRRARATSGLLGLWPNRRPSQNLWPQTRIKSNIYTPVAPVV